MNVGEALGLVSEVLTFVGVGIGSPLLLYGWLRRRLDGRRVPVEVVIIYDEDGARVRWFAEDDFYERTLQPRERAVVEGEQHRIGFVSDRDPSSMYWDPRSSIATVSLALGSVLVGVGVLGFVASLLALLIG